MTTTKFSPGDRVLCFDSSLPASGKKGTVKQVFQISVDVQHDDMLLGNYHPKQLRRLREKTRVVWESVYPVGTNEAGDGLFRVSDQIMLERFSLSRFFGKRVRIVITEAKEKE